MPVLTSSLKGAFISIKRSGCCIGFGLIHAYAPARRVIEQITVFVLLARVNLAVRMVVGEDKNRGAAAQRGFNDATWIHSCSVDGPFLEALDAIPL